MILLKKGDSGKLVYYMQKRLKKMGEYGDGLRADGFYGDMTEAAVYDFQVRWDLLADGIVGPRTWTALLSSGKELTGGSVSVKEETLDIVKEVIEGQGVSDAAYLLICEAWSWIGAQEDPWGSNKGSSIMRLIQGTQVTGVKKMKESEYKKHWGIQQAWFFPPWCAIAVSSWFAEAFDAKSWSDIPFGNWFGGVTQTVKWADKHGVWREVGDGAVKPGELFVMGRAGSGSDDGGALPSHAGHIGIVAWDDGDYVVTIEGNAGNAVRTKRRLKSDIIGFIDWESANK